MLAVRGVTPGSATEKAELARWAFQHQDLPVLRKAAPAGASSSRRTRDGGVCEVPAEKSVAELERMSVAELRDMLRQRGVGEGSATEKAELVQWVWQHQKLPVLWAAREQKKKSGRRGRRSFFGFGDDSEPYDCPRDDPKQQDPRGPELLEADRPEQLEGGTDQRLLEAGEAEEPAPSSWRWWPWAVGGLSVAAAAAVFGSAAANEAVADETA